MGVNLSIKDVPDEIAERLRQRAARNHRSLQGELMSIVERAAYRDIFDYGGLLSDLDGNLFSNLDKAVQNAREFAGDVINALRAAQKAGEAA